VAKKKNHKQTYVRLTLVTSLFHLMVAGFIVAIFLLDLNIDNKNLIASILAPLVFVGLIYNLLIARPLIRRREFLAKYLQFLLVVAEAAVVVYFTGGSSSVWYPVFLILIIGGSVLGFTAFFINAGLVAILYVGDILGVCWGSCGGLLGRFWGSSGGLLGVCWADVIGLLGVWVYLRGVLGVL
jgi:Na+/melibiose symporter-like transporter